LAITVVPKPRDLKWSNFKVVPSLPDEDAHIDIGFTFPNKPFRKVDGAWMMAEEFELTVSPVAKIKEGANKTADLLSHEQGHYNIGILTGEAMARDLMALSAPTQQGLVTAINAAFDLHRKTRMKAIQEKYDDDTNHSQNAGEQKRWDDMISQCMGRTPTCGRLDGMAL
jgi:hypothetical protein